MTVATPLFRAALATENTMVFRTVRQTFESGFPTAYSGCLNATFKQPGLAATEQEAFSFLNFSIFCIFKLSIFLQTGRMLHPRSPLVIFALDYLKCWAFDAVKVTLGFMFALVASGLRLSF